MKLPYTFLKAWPQGLTASALSFVIAFTSATIHAADTDNDRIDDAYETTHGLNVGIDDRYGDADGDGFPNLAEYLKDTSASSASSVPTADRVVGPGETYTTISAALASLTADDQIILVKPGVYEEAINNTGGSAKRVFIISESVDPNATTINGSSSTTLASTKDVYLRGFTLTGTGSYRVSLTGSGHYGIVQCILRGSSYGIYSRPSSSSVRNHVDIIGTMIQAGSWGIYGESNSSTFRLVHTTFYGNSSHAIYSSTSNGGGSIYSLTNCVIWPNGSSPFHLSGTTLTATYSCIKGTSVYSGTGNINSNPQLVQGYLSSASPCVDAGTSATLVPSVPEDVRGDARSIGSGPDMGAHEYGTGGSWAGDFDGDGISDHDELYVHGTQFFSSDTDGDRMDDGYEVTHGLSPLVDDRYGDADGDGFPNLAEYLKGTSASNASSVPTADRVVGPGETYTTISAALASLTADDQIILVKPGVYEELINNASGSSRRLFLVAEAADANLTWIVNPGTTGNTVSSNKDIYLRGFTLINGLGNACNGVNLTGAGNHGIVQCVMRGHQSAVSVSPSASPRTIVNLVGCMLQDGTSYGVNAVGNAATYRISHTTICGHGSSSIFNAASGNSFTITNSILWNNGSTQITLAQSASVTATYSCIRGSSVYTGTGNINSDPLLAQGYLPASSPCVDTGTGGVAPQVVKDVRGDARIVGAAPDMGAHEYSTTGVWSGDLDGDGISDHD